MANAKLSQNHGKSWSLKLWSFFRSASLGLIALMTTAAFSQSSAPSSGQAKREAPVTQHAKGTFEVKMTPLTADETVGGEAIGRYALGKQFHGELEATSKGLMLGGGDRSKGMAGYVAMERVTGTLGGHKGEFSLQHFGTMDKGGLHLQVVVVPGSGRGELAGIAGTMTITNDAGRHSYEFDYTLPEN